MVSEKFRHQLRQEAEKWQAEGLIDEGLYTELAQRYQFAALETAASNRFIMILIGLGSVLLGLAVITFVAANWQVWSREVKVFLLMGLFAGVNIAGFYLWRYPEQRWQTRLGKGLLLFGALILGANLGLMSQMFHQSGPLYHLYLVWGLGVLTMAYSLRFTLLAILSVILIGIGYFRGLYDLSSTSDFSIFKLALEHLPLLASISFIPLAYWCRSRWLFCLATILIILSLEINLISIEADFLKYSLVLSGLLAALNSCVPPALLWAYRDSLWNFSDETISFHPISRKLGVLLLSVMFYFFSFNIWNYLPSQSTGEIAGESWFKLIDIVLFTGLALWSWWRLGYESSSRWRIELTSTVIATMILITGLSVGWFASGHLLGATGAFIFNALLFTLAVGLVREALTTGKRLGFWWGVILIVLQLMSRMFEYDTGLLFKAFVLFLCGISIILAGIWFERYLKSHNEQ